VALEGLDRHIKLSARGMLGKRLEQSAQRISDAGGIRHVVWRRAAIEDPRRHAEQGRCRCAPIGLELAHRHDRIVVKVARARIDQGVKRSDRQAAARDRVQERGRDRIRRRVAGRPAAQRVAPPLQPDLARQRLVRDLPDARDFDVEPIEREKMRTPVGRRKQAGQEAVLVRLPHQRLAMGISVLHRQPNGAFIR
jgi:hypothetical protein